MSYYLENNVIFSFWTGKNRMSDDRKSSLATIRKNSACDLRLVTPENIDEYIVDEYPFHPAYEFLSLTQKSDYLRCYFMHHLGGGYLDIKPINHPWNTYFELLRNHPELFAVGYTEPDASCVAPFADNTKEMMANYKKLIGNGAFIFRPNTEFTKLWYQAQYDLLDESYELLKKHPARFPTDCYEAPSPYWLLRRYGLGRSKYPIRWTGLQGDLFHPLCYRFTDRIDKSLPAPDFSVAYR